MNYLMRTVEPDLGVPVFRAFDREVLSTAAAVLQIPELVPAEREVIPSYVELARKLFTMPMKAGGLSFRSMEKISPLAYYACTALAAQRLSEWTTPDGTTLAEHHTEVTQAVAACHARITELATVAEHPDFTEALAELIPEQPSIGALIQAYGSNGSLDGMHLGLQRSLTQLVEKADRARMEPTLSVEAKALLVSNSAQWASMWLVTVPADSKPWLRLSDELFRIAMHLRLGLKITAPDIPCVCGREPSLQAKPWHPLSCDSNSGLWSARHDGVKQIIASLMTAAGASVLIEPTPGQMRRGFSDGRRPDLLIHMGHRTILADVTVKHPLAPSYVPVLSQTPLGVAREGERIKNRLYAAEARAMGMEFIPISIETTGGWGPAAVELVKAVASHAVEHSSRGSRQSHSRHGLGSATWKCLPGAHCLSEVRSSACRPGSA
jgi:hypothetical protein